MRLQDKVALITGSSRGIGAAIARAMAREGAKVVVTWCESQELARDVVADIRTSTHDRAIFCQLDVRDRQSIKAAYAFAVDTYGRLDILVNNAGINRTNDIDKQTEGEMADVMGVNALGPWRCSQIAVGCHGQQPFMNDGGSIIMIGSISGQNGGPRTTSYCMAKKSLEGLVDNYAKNLGDRGIRVNVVHPGIIESELTDQTMPAQMKEERLSQVVLGRLGAYDDVAQACVFLAENTWITGAKLNVNGGEANAFV